MANNNSRKWFWRTKTQSQVVKTEIPSWYIGIEESYLAKIGERNALNEEIALLRDQLLLCMKDDKLRKIDTTRTEVMIVRGYDGRRVDSRKLKTKYPSVFLECSNRYSMDEHLQISIKH